MRLKLYLGVVVLGLLGLGCSGNVDPVAAENETFTVDPTATMGPEEAAKAMEEQQKKQAEQDKAAIKQ